MLIEAETVNLTSQRSGERGAALIMALMVSLILVFLGMGLLGEALALRTKTTYEALLASRILTPLGMESTTITCIQCDTDFVFSAQDQEKYERMVSISPGVVRCVENINQATAIIIKKENIKISKRNTFE